MAKGAKVKAKVYKKILEMFPGSFMYNSDKELRIPVTEDGEPIQLKLTLTVSKTPVENDNAVAAATEQEEGSFPSPVGSPVATPQVSDEEKQTLQAMMERLGL
jgi:hypothetical protein